MGVVFRDYCGEVLAAGSTLLPNCHKPHIAEAIAFRLAAETITNHSFGLVQFKSDCQRLVQARKKQEFSGNKYLESVANDCVRILNSRSSYSLIFAHRTTNRTADFFWLILLLSVKKDIGSRRSLTSC